MAISSTAQGQPETDPGGGRGTGISCNVPASSPWKPEWNLGFYDGAGKVPACYFSGTTSPSHPGVGEVRFSGPFELYGFQDGAR